MKQEWIWARIQSFADEVVTELAKEFQIGYDFSLNKLNLATDHELRVVVKKLEESEEKEGELVEEPAADHDKDSMPPIDV